MTCAKKRVTCIIITRKGDAFWGENTCDEPQEICPREDGEGYDKCTEVCKQPNHAEIDALNAALESGYDLSCALAILTGIDHMCKPCARALSEAGVTEIILRA